MRKQSLRPPPRRPREAKRGQVPCRARRHGDLRSGFAVAWSERPFLSSQRELLVSIGSTSPASIPFAFRSPSGHRTTPLLTGALACHLAINCGLGLLLRNTGSQFTCATARPSEPDANGAAPPKNETPNCNVRFKSRPPCSVIRRGSACRVGSAGPVARRTARRQPRSHHPVVHP